MIKLPHSVSQTRKHIAKKDPKAILKADTDDVTLPVTLRTKLKALQLLIKNKELDGDKRKEIIDLFKEYIDDVTHKQIILIPKEEYRDGLNELGAVKERKDLLDAAFKLEKEL